MSLPTVANLCSTNHRAIAFLGDDCPLCSLKADAVPDHRWNRVGRPLKDGHIWPHTYQLLQVLRRQYAPKVDDTTLQGLLPHPADYIGRRP